MHPSCQPISFKRNRVVSHERCPHRYPNASRLNDSRQTRVIQNGPKLRRRTQRGQTWRLDQSGGAIQACLWVCKGACRRARGAEDPGKPGEQSLQGKVGKLPLPFLLLSLQQDPPCNHFPSSSSPQPPHFFITAIEAFFLQLLPIPFSYTKLTIVSPSTISRKNKLCNDSIHLSVVCRETRQAGRPKPEDLWLAEIDAGWAQLNL